MGLDVDGADGVRHDDGVEPVVDGLGRRRLDAVVGREAGDEDTPDAEAIELRRELGAGEAGVAVGRRVCALLHHVVDRVGIEVRMELGPCRSLDAVFGPGTALLREGRVSGRVEILRRDDVLEELHQRVDDRHDRIAVGDG